MQLVKSCMKTLMYQHALDLRMAASSRHVHICFDFNLTFIRAEPRLKLIVSQAEEEDKLEVTFKLHFHGVFTLY